jgi:hypothetical protein
MSVLKVAKKPVKVAWDVSKKNENGSVQNSKGELKIVNLDFKQYDSLEEFQNEAGGPDSFLKWLNKQVEAICKRDAVAAGKSAGVEETPEKREEKARDAARKYNPAKSVNRKEGTKQKIEAYENAEKVAAEIRSNPALMTPEKMMELLAMFAK